MKTRLHFDIHAQPDETTCGPTCLQALYAYYDDPIVLSTVIEEVDQFKEGGTLAVLLGCHALQRGYRVKIYSYNMTVFDPTWFALPPEGLQEKLRAQLLYKSDEKLHLVTRSYLRFLELGGQLRFDELNEELIQSYLRQSKPILAGVSATYLYRTAREFGPRMDYDDVRGHPSGHFIVLCGYDMISRSLLIADPLYPNPVKDQQIYSLRTERVLHSILLGVLTYDANLLILEPDAADE